MDDVMIAYLPSNGSWCKQPLPHMTLVYCGPEPTATLPELVSAAIIAGTITGPFSLRVQTVDVFGEGIDQVDVLRLESSPRLLAARQSVEKWNVSEYKEFKPHATVGPMGSATEVPSHLYFDRILVAWKDRHITHYLG